ncbi:MAG: hypothetical protein WB524_09030 [Acidobacteriaceae bacterium]
MKTLDGLKSEILAYLYGYTTLDAFRQRCASLTIEAGASRTIKDADEKEALGIANQLIGDFSDFDEGYLSEAALQQNLRNLIFGGSSSRRFEIQIGQPPAAAFTTGMTTGWVDLASFAFLGKKPSSVLA